MNVLFLSTWSPYPPNNGSRIRAFNLLRALAKSHKVTVVTFVGDGHQQDELQGLPEATEIALTPVVDDPYRHVGRSRWVKFASPVPVAYWPSRPMRQAVAEAAAVSRWDAVVCLQVPVARYALQLEDVPRVLDIDTALSYQMLERHLQQACFMARLRTWVSLQKACLFEASLFRRFQACTVVASKELDFLSSMLSSNNVSLCTLPNGVDCETNRPGLASPMPNSLVYNGALTYSANYDAMQYFLSGVYPLIRRELPEVKLTITGSTEGVHLAGLQLDRSVLLSGYVEDVRPLVAGAAACITPIRQGGGTRIKILEAMALGTPVVSTSKGAEGLAVTAGRDILIADEPAEFAAQVVRLLGDKALGQQLALQARSLVEKQYDWAQIGRRFVDLVEKAANTRMPRERGRR
jgi:glycosyltransferase involved in cell wall biosynthesis